MFTEDDVNVHLLDDYVLKKQFTVRKTHYDMGEWGEGFLQDMGVGPEKINDPHVHTAEKKNLQYTRQANNLPKINLEWALSYEWEFYEFVRSFLSAGWMDGWKNMVE